MQAFARIRDITDTIAPVAPDCSNSVVYDLFHDNSDLMALAVATADGEALGLVERHAFSLTMAGEYGRALYSAKPVTTLMISDAIQVDIDTPLSEFTEMTLSDRPSDLMRGFIVTEQGRYAGVGAALSVLRAISLEQKRAEDRIRHLAHYDPLTGLANRALFTREIDAALSRVQRQNHRVALMCLDLDRFKMVNDSCGHLIGDQVLIEVAKRLRDCVRRGDVAARMGGDEFAIIQSIDAPDDARVLCERIISAMAAPIVVNDRQFDIGASIGVALAPDDGMDAGNLMSRADLAMYRVKGEGRNGWRFYHADMDAQLQDRVQLEKDLRLGLKQGQFTLDYQPLLDLATGQIVAFEALLRWEHPTRGRVAPGDFIPLAEDCGLIGPLGEWVLNAACQAAAQWPQPWRIAVNISPLQFRQNDLIDQVRRALAASGLDPRRLELEITESVIFESETRNIEVLQALRAMGARIAMDDFGTGYSSLSYLRSFVFDKIKIDRAFVRDLPHDGDALSIIRAIIDMAQSLGVRITAEGVETEAQMNALRDLNCAEAQGYLIGRPAPDVSAYDGSDMRLAG
ncbi:MAG: putative bifunctional diguanylate cyclase/phosphodiesterase [Asticcacaulis sp.]|uniref:putative bifunctional diguanylate cyclase/phosphodiesterase n=1 Tax=Asticcacaulis sp. TaxID=1872648 RepID=UPI003F7C17B8